MSYILISNNNVMVEHKKSNSGGSKKRRSNPYEHHRRDSSSSDNKERSRSRSRSSPEHESKAKRVAAAEAARREAEEKARREAEEKARREAEASSQFNVPPIFMVIKTITCPDPNTSRIYIRGNNYTQTLGDFQKQFKLSEKSKKKTIQEITNCYDYSSETHACHTLDRDSYQGLYPCLELNPHSSNLSDIISRIKSHVGAGALKSFFLFLSDKSPVSSDINQDLSYPKEITTIEGFEDTHKFSKFHGIIQTNCRAKLPHGYDHASSEVIITPRFDGVIVYVSLKYRSNDMALGFLSQWFDGLKPQSATNLGTDLLKINYFKDVLFRACKSTGDSFFPFWRGGKKKQKHKKMTKKRLNKYKNLESKRRQKGKRKQKDIVNK